MRDVRRVGEKGDEMGWMTAQRGRLVRRAKGDVNENVRALQIVTK